MHVSKLVWGVLVGVLIAFTSGCTNNQVQSVSGTKMVAVGTVEVNPDGKTVEQQNIHDRIKTDNTPGSIKHLYIISAYSGQVLIYSTVKGKVTSSNKRLTPSQVSSETAFTFQVGENQQYTNQVLGEDGTYGSSVEYLYWWDTKGFYHQQYVTGGMILHISDQPLSVKGVIINMELTKKPE